MLHMKRLILEDKTLYIEKYKKLDILSKTLIQTTDYQIEGTSLSVLQMDSHLLIIEGNIELVRKRHEHI